MAYNEPSDKAATATRSDFLDALYGAVDSRLWIELRCLHPQTGEVRRLWMPPRRRETILGQADALNREGFSIYFAPCPRLRQQGDAESAALLPALWVDIDCDGDPSQREVALTKVQAFSPAPSMIVDSGGGWHAYYLLAESLSLPDGAARQRTAGLLKGLFAALGADPEYVKSVASIMRLPDTTNTKPARRGARVQVVMCDPARRYTIADFAWLETSSKRSSAPLKPDLPTKNGHAPLPKVTLEYLTHGAPEGMRNQALFEAACQFRDARYSEAEAVQQLVARYLADGVGENPAARTHEAETTIASAYRRSARDSLPPPVDRRDASTHQVDMFVARFQASADTRERPRPEHIAAAVQACAALDPIQWAAERRRIRAVCGGDYRLSDLDRMYRQARRETARTQVGTGAPAQERYLEAEGGMVYERQTERGLLRQGVAAWTAQVKEWVTRIDDEGHPAHVMRLDLRHAARSLTLDVPSELFGDASALQRFIAAQAGGIYAVRAGMSKHLVPAILALSGEPPQRATYGFVGWTHRDGRWLYIAPQVSVSAQGVISQPPEVELESRLRDYGLADTGWEESLAAFSSTLAVLPEPLAPALIGFAMLPIVQRFFPAAAPRPAVHLAGTSGSGKSEIAALLASFYGRFTRDTPPAQWGDTVNTVETLGYALADALYWVDDYKTCYADERTFTRYLQSYSRGMGRGRLTREAKLRQERPCRGLLLSTGETTIEGEASVVARMLVLEIPPWEQRDPRGQTLARADALRHLLPGFTTHFAAWIAARADSGQLARELAQGFETSVQGYREKLSALGSRQANTGRMIQNWAVLVTVYRLLRRFLETHGAGEALPGWRDAILQTVQTVQQERAGQVFIDTLGQLIASGQVTLAADLRNPEPPRPGVPIVGYVDGPYVYLLPDVAYREVSRGQPPRFTAAAIGAQLKEEGWLIPGQATLTVQRRVRGLATRFWQLKADCLGEGAISEP